MRYKSASNWKWVSRSDFASPSSPVNFKPNNKTNDRQGRKALAQIKQENHHGPKPQSMTHLPDSAKPGWSRGNMLRVEMCQLRRPAGYWWLWKVGSPSQRAPPVPTSTVTTSEQCTTVGGGRKQAQPCSPWRETKGETGQPTIITVCNPMNSNLTKQSSLPGHRPHWEKLLGVQSKLNRTRILGTKEREDPDKSRGGKQSLYISLSPRPWIWTPCEKNRRENSEPQSWDSYPAPPLPSGLTESNRKEVWSNPTLGCDKKKENIEQTNALRDSEGTLESQAHETDEN